MPPPQKDPIFQAIPEDQYPFLFKKANNGGKTMYPAVTCPECNSDLLCFHDDENATCACGNDFKYMTKAEKSPIDQERHEYLKQLIQDALWKTYVSTKEEAYSDLYHKWFNKFYEVDIRIIEA